MRSRARHLRSTIFKLWWELHLGCCVRISCEEKWHLCGSVMWYLRASQSIPSPCPVGEVLLTILCKSQMVSAQLEAFLAGPWLVVVMFSLGESHTAKRTVLIVVCYWGLGQGHLRSSHLLSTTRNVIHRASKQFSSLGSSWIWMPIVYHLGARPPPPENTLPDHDLLAFGSQG